MNKFYGNVGYIETAELRPGFWGTKEVILPYYGEWLRRSAKFQISSDSTIDDKTLSNELSIVSDPYANQHFSSMRFVEHAGVKWKITQVEPRYPRLILTLGGVYNGESIDDSSDDSDEV